MTASTLTRRTLLAGAAAAGAAWAGGAIAADHAPAIHVVRDPSCGCCTAWIAILQREGFEVTQEAMSGPALERHKRERGIPAAMASCHTGTVAGYAIEGHVPPADIRRLLRERPDAVGLAVPGMPHGSPGMGPESDREAYAVHLISRDGTTRVFTAYEAA